MRHLEIAGRKGYQYATEHPYADGSAALIWAMRWFPTKSEVRAFMCSWHKANH